MEFNKEKLRQIRGLLLFAALLVFLLIYSDFILEGIGVGFGIIKPFLIGGVIAFILNILLVRVEKFLTKYWKGKKLEKMIRPAGILLSIVILILLIALLVGTVLPQLAKTTAEIANEIPSFFNKTMKRLEELSVQYPQLEQYVKELEVLDLDWKTIMAGIVDFLKNGISNMLFSTVTVAGSIIGGVVNGVISFIFAIYILAGKEKLQDQCERILRAYSPGKIYDMVFKVCRLLYQNFSNFITGQCKEAVILGLMFVISMILCRMPYALLVGVLIAFTALIPIVGAFIGCIVGAFLILVESPIKALWFIVLFLVLQQIEGNLIYPRVVGNSVGLPAIWVLAAISVGGSLFGIVGMLFFIPLVSTFYILLRDSVNMRNKVRLESVDNKKNGEEKNEIS